MRRILFLFGILWLVYAIVPFPTVSEESNEPYVYPGKVRQFKEKRPFVLKDKKTGWIFYLESNRRFISAIDKNGKVVWHCDPFEQAGLESYRFEQPVVRWMGFLTNDDSLIRIVYDSSQFGDLNKKDGKFTYQGQD